MKRLQFTYEQWLGFEALRRGAKQPTRHVVANLRMPERTDDRHRVIGVLDQRKLFVGKND